MADRPIIFSAPMVRALVDGRKTQTRRIVRSVPTPPSMEVRPNHAAKHDLPYLDAYCGQRKTTANPRGMSDLWCWWTRDDRMGAEFKVPFVPGDRLWVREAWRPTYNADGWREDLGRVATPADFDPTITAIEYLADGTDELAGKNRPSIHMPRWASRLTLTVTDVRIQRLQDISEQDAVAEGLSCLSKDDGRTWKYGIADRDGWPGTDDVGWPWSEWNVDARVAYARIWNRLHGLGAWAANPWIAAISFSVWRGNIDTYPHSISADAREVSPCG